MQPTILYYMKRTLYEQSRDLSNLLLFFKIGIVARRYHSYQQWYLLGFKQVYIIVFYLAASMQPSISSIILSLFDGSTWCDPLCQWHCVYVTTLIAAIHYNKRSVVDSIAAVNFVWKVFEKHLQASHSFMGNVLIWQFHNSNCSHPLSIVNVLEEQL